VGAVNDAPQISGLSELPVTQGSEVSLGGHWLVQDPDSDPKALTYTVTTAPQQGQLYRGNVLLGTGSQFTQTELTTGLIVYRHTGLSLAGDTLQLIASDAQGATLSSGPLIVSVAVNAQPTINNLSPNPSLGNVSNNAGLVDLPSTTRTETSTSITSAKASTPAQPNGKVASTSQATKTAPNLDMAATNS
jgi:hypothetical protein